MRDPRFGGFSPRLCVSAFLGGCAVAAALTMARGGITPPRVHDEFSYLLAADTYAHGRLANPTPPLADHFRSENILVVPTYASKYPPAQGLVLALGQVLTGEPIVGVWLSYGLMCAAFAWMLLGWVPRRWAVWGTLLAGLWLVGRQTLSPSFEAAFWATSYWGGAVAAAGGALVFGGLRRVARRPAVFPALMTAFGLAVLANSRPAEGLGVTLVPGAVLAAWLAFGRRWPARARFGRVALSMALVLGLTAAGMGWLNYRVTGHPLRLPYVAYHAQQGGWRPFLARADSAGVVQPERRRSLVMRAVESLLWEFQDHGLKPGYGLNSVRRFYFPAYLAVLALGLPWALRDRWTWVPLAATAMVGGVLVLETFRLPHYAAPAAGPLALLFTLSARRLGLWRVRDRRAGIWLTRLCLAGALVYALVSVRIALANQGRERTLWPAKRAALLGRLSADGRRHIVLVSYGPRHTRGAEWVYNGADIEGAPVVWAHSLGAERDSVLVARYGGRTAWRLHVDEDDGPLGLEPFGP